MNGKSCHEPRSLPVKPVTVHLRWAQAFCKRIA